MIELAEKIVTKLRPLDAAFQENTFPVDFHRAKNTGGGGVTIAIVDGDQPTRPLLAEKLARAEKFQCVGLYRSGKSALTGLPATRPDMVLMEMNLPDMSGVDCLRRLKPALPETTFIVLTSSAAPENIFSALSAGANGYLLQQNSDDELLAALHHIQLRGATLNAEIARKILRSFQPARLASSYLEPLSARQLEVLELLTQGKTYEQISRHIQVGPQTVRTHIRRLFKKLQVHSRSQAVANYTQANRSDLIDQDYSETN